MSDDSALVKPLEPSPEIAGIEPAGWIVTNPQTGYVILWSRDRGRAVDVHAKYAGSKIEPLYAASALTRLERERDEAREDFRELQEVFDMRWKADRRAVKRWRDAHPGNELVMPDADLVVWLLGRLDDAEKALQPFAKFAEKARRFVEGRANNGGSPIMPVNDFRLADFQRARAFLTEGASDEAQ